MTISFQDVDGSLGSYAEPRSLLDLSRDPAAMVGLRDALDRRVVVHMLLAEPARIVEIEAVVAMLGEPKILHHSRPRCGPAVDEPDT